MTTTISTAIEIKAPASTVWNILTDFPSYPQWNPFITSISGTPAVGEQIEAHIQPPGGRGMTFKPTVLAADRDREFRWLGKLFVKGLFDGEHIFRIEQLESDRVRFVQEEQFNGILVPLLKGMFSSTEQGFNDMNAALKSRAESTNP